MIQTSLHTHIHVFIYTQMYIYVEGAIEGCRERERERETPSETESERGRERERERERERWTQTMERDRPCMKQLFLRNGTHMHGGCRCVIASQPCHTVASHVSVILAGPIPGTTQHVITVFCLPRKLRKSRTCADPWCCSPRHASETAKALLCIS